MGKCKKNVKIIGFFDIFLHILHKMKENLGQEHVKEAFCPSREKLEQFSLMSLENESCSGFNATFPPILP